MKGLCAITVCFAVLAPLASSQADMVRPDALEPGSQDVRTVPWDGRAADQGLGAAFRPGADSGSAASLWPAAFPPPPIAPLPALPADASPDAKPQVELPGGPSSFALLLSGLGTLGLWGCGRLAQGHHLAHIPTWLHTGGPDSVRLATLLDPTSSPPLVAAFLTPSSTDEQNPMQFSRPRPSGCWASQFKSPLNPARAPPTPSRAHTSCT
jgi:hypothetical protein